MSKAKESNGEVERIDITDRVKCYAKGKTFECDCEQGFGVTFETRTVLCPTCQALLIDEEAENREAPQEEDGQTTFDAWT